MQIKIAKSAGFCFGVRRAIDLADKTVKEKKKIYTLGPLIHNPQEVTRLARKGIRPVKSPGKLKKVTLILRTHGIPSNLRKTLEKKDLTLVDAACPFVKRAQEIVKKLAGRDSDRIIIVGEKTHPEVVALVSYGKRKCVVVENKNDLKKIKLAGRASVLSQTTQSPENFISVISELKRNGVSVKSFDTICRATIDRQSAASGLAKKADVMVVVGGKNSGNTRRLYQICRSFTRAHHIETANQLKKNWFKGAKTVGITAGASTPDWIIDEVKKQISAFRFQPSAKAKSLS
jgi:4-hydroxy-3-methylbut-2-en-1-yl diphosphate reductase